MKRKWIAEPDEFFIGYRPQAPPRTAAFLRKFLIVVGSLIVLISIAIVVSQQPFSSSEFDYGIYTTLEGEISSYPVPHLKLHKGQDQTGNAKYQTVLLVGFGKAGAKETLAKFEAQLGALEGRSVKISGELIHGHGKELLQLSEDRVPEILQQPGDKKSVQLNSQGVPSVIRGEIMDPKCFFGVMKPGEGKTHRSCAIRCISGGIPPILQSTASQYYLLLDEHFQPVNQQVLDFVGDNIELSGRVVDWDDWKILLVEAATLKGQASARKLVQNLVSMEEGMTKCGFD